MLVGEDFQLPRGRADKRAELMSCEECRAGEWPPGGGTHTADSVVKTQGHETLFAFLNRESHETDGEERSSKMEDESRRLRRRCWMRSCCWWAEEVQEEEEDGGRRELDELAEEVKMEEVRLRKSRSSSSLPPAEVCGPSGCFLQRVTGPGHRAGSHGSTCLRR